ncbi:MAG: DUF1761 domain-containing protein [Flavobacteriaceae bacterium]
MAFAGINYLAVFLAAVASFVFGAIWYMALSRQWQRAAGLEGRLPGRKGFAAALPFIISFVGELIMAHVLAGAVGHLSAGVTLTNALISALILWAGFVATTTTIAHRYQMAPWSLTFIDGGHWLGVMLVQGLVIGLFGV